MSGRPFLPEAGEPSLPTAPILEFLEEFRQRDGLNEFTRRYAARFDTTPRTGWRHVCRLRQEPTAPASLIDRMAVLLGHHPLEIYGDRWAAS